MMDTRRPIAGRNGRALAATVLAVLAGGVHLVAGVEHLTEEPILGWGMFAVGGAQLLGAWLLWTRPSPLVAGLMLMGTLLALTLFAVQHTVGLPGLTHKESAVELPTHTHAADHADHDTEHTTEPEWREPLALVNLGTEVLLILVLIPLVVQRQAHGTRSAIEFAYLGPQPAS